MRDLGERVEDTMMLIHSDEAVVNILDLYYMVCAAGFMLEHDKDGRWKKDLEHIVTEYGPLVFSTADAIEQEAGDATIIRADQQEG